MLGTVKGMIATDMPMIGSPWIMSGFAMLYGRSNLADRMPAFANVVISNVPGPPKTLYVAGAKMVSYYPGFHSLSWHRAEHHRAELCRLHGFRVDRLPPRDAAIGNLRAYSRHESRLCRT